MRIGTWNLEGRCSAAHQAFLLDLDCDVLLLTEVRETFSLPGYQFHLGDAEMVKGRRWAAVASRASLTRLPDPHPASAMAEVNGWTFCSSILPWKGTGNVDPWVGANTGERTASCVADLLVHLPADRLIWGGDWNHALSGREYAGALAGRTAVLEALAKLELEVPTAALPHRIDGLLSIDHVAVPRGTDASARGVSARKGGLELSDHDASVVTMY